MWALMVKCRITQVLSLKGCFRLAHAVLCIAAGPPLQATANITPPLNSFQICMPIEKLFPLTHSVSSITSSCFLTCVMSCIVL